MLGQLASRVRRWLERRDVPVWYSPAYRLPLASLEASAKVDPRRADRAVTYAIESGIVTAASVRAPVKASYEELARVHGHDHLHSLSRADVLANIFAVDPSDIQPDEVMATVRLATGGTISAARTALRTESATYNLLGGFHHAGPHSAAGMCPVNDIAVAVAAVRREGFSGRVAIIDTDAHPPDGLWECFREDDDVSIGSLSAADWGPLPGVDETVLPSGTGDEAYLDALASLLHRLRRADLSFVIAGGDVLAGDFFGGLSLTLGGVRERDLRLADWCRGRASVWLPGGGYHRDAWRVLAGSLTALALGSRETVPVEFDATHARFSNIARALDSVELHGNDELSFDDVLGDLGVAARPVPRLLGYYTTEGIEHALARYGVLEHLSRLGYHRFRVAVDSDERGHRMRLFARSRGAEHLLIELVVEKRTIDGYDLLYVHWLTLRNPRGKFSARRPPLPGQHHPGLGIAEEAGELLLQMARRLGLDGVAFRPAWYHTAYAARYRARFTDPKRQGEFEAMQRDFRGVPLLDASRAMATGRVRRNGEPYAWQAEVMAYIPDADLDRDAVERARDAVRFTIEPAADAPESGDHWLSSE